MKEIMYVVLSKKAESFLYQATNRIVKHKYIDFQPKISVILNDNKVYLEIYELIKEYIDSDYYIYLLFKNDRSNRFKLYYNKNNSKLEFMGVEYGTKELLNRYKPKLRLSKLIKI